MPLEKLKSARKRTIGTKQTQKAVEKDAVSLVFIARDAEGQVIRTLETLCKEKDVEIIYIDSMELLGKACGIDVGSASAAILVE
jgi:large subunit ribosomal protein L7A